jgi:hypothetical protein
MCLQSADPIVTVTKIEVKWGHLCNVREFVVCTPSHNTQHNLAVEKKKIWKLKNTNITILIYCISTLFEPILFAFIEKISLCTAKVDNLWTSIPLEKKPKIINAIPGTQNVAYIFLCDGALLAVVGIRYTWTSTYYTSSLVWPIIALIADPNERTWTDVGITNHTLAITFLTETTNSCKIRKNVNMLFDPQTTLARKLKNSEI